MTYDEVFKSLDVAARANLNARGVREYEAYKADLVARQVPPDEVDEILRGHIWDASEDADDTEDSAVIVATKSPASPIAKR